MAGAQAGARPGPADPRAPVPATEYRSAFSGFRPYSEVELVPWRAANDEVGRSGGRTAAQGTAAENAKKPAAKAPASPHGAGHQ
jgi:hypothetical protein